MSTACRGFNFQFSRNPWRNPSNIVLKNCFLLACSVGYENDYHLIDEACLKISDEAKVFCERRA